MVLSADVLSEEAILKWYNEAHLAKGKSVFLEQMKKFVEWLKNAEEGERGGPLRFSAKSMAGLCALPCLLFHAHRAPVALTDVFFSSRVRVRGGGGGGLRTCSCNNHVDLYFYNNNSIRCSRKIYYPTWSKSPPLLFPTTSYLVLW